LGPLLASLVGAPSAQAFGVTDPYRVAYAVEDESDLMKALRRLASLIVLTALLATPCAEADQSGMSRITVLPLPNARIEDALRQGLKDVGLVEGQNIFIDWLRFPVTDDRLKSLPQELARSSHNVLVALGSQLTYAALQSKSGAVVFLVGDPVGARFAETLARPAGLGTGISVSTTDLNSKRLEFLKALAPKAKRIVFLTNPASALVGPRPLDSAAKALGLQLTRLEARNVTELDAALRQLPRTRAEAVLVSGDVLLLANKAKVAEAIREARLPAMFPWSEYHDNDVVASYGPNLPIGMRRLAPYVEKILKGTPPGDIPIEQMSEYELTIDLRVAHAAGIDVPQDLLLRADRVIR